MSTPDEVTVAIGELALLADGDEVLDVGAFRQHRSGEKKAAGFGCGDVRRIAEGAQVADKTAEGSFVLHQGDDVYEIDAIHRESLIILEMFFVHGLRC